MILLPVFIVKCTQTHTEKKGVGWGGMGGEGGEGERVVFLSSLINLHFTILLICTEIKTEEVLNAKLI